MTIIGLEVMIIACNMQYPLIDDISFYSCKYTVSVTYYLLNHCEIENTKTEKCH